MLKLNERNPSGGFGTLAAIKNLSYNNLRPNKVYSLLVLLSRN